MRRGFVIAIDPAGECTYLPSPKGEYGKAKELFKRTDAATPDGNDKIAELQLIDSLAGRVKRRKYLSSDQVKANAKAAEDEKRRVANEKAAAEKAEREKATKAAAQITAAEKAGREQEKKQAAERAEREKIDHPKK